MPEPDLVAFAERLRSLRAEAGLSGRELADRADISVSYLRVLESGSNSKTGKPSRPSFELAERIGRVVNDEAGELLRLAGWEPSNSTRVADVRRPRPPANVDALMKDLRMAVRDLSRRSAFMHERAVNRLEQFDAEFSRLAAGTLDCAPEDEPHVTRVAVLSCESHLRAVSYDDLAWWGRSLGEKYRETHELLRRDHPDVDITRIFLIEPTDLSVLRSTLQWHFDLGITTYLLYLDEVNERSLEDFILCDLRLLRTAVPVSDATKKAEFTDDPRRINEKFVAFETLRRRAIETRGALTSVDEVDRMVGS